MLTKGEKYPCTFTVWAYFPKAVGTEFKKGQLLQIVEESDQWAMSDLFQQYIKLGFKEQVTIALDDTWINIFYHDWFGWRIVTSDVKAR